MKGLIKKSSCLVLLTAFLAGCSKNDEAPYVPPVIEGSITAALGEELENQVFVNLAKKELLSVPAGSWDLAFQSSGGTAIRVNTGKKSSVYIAETTDFASVTSAPAARAFAYDDPAAMSDPSKTAIGEWMAAGASKNLVYIINLGNDAPASSNPLGYKKMQVTGFEDGVYHIKYANLDGTEAGEADIPVNTRTNYTYYSFAKGVVQVEPDKDSWDLAFAGITVAGGGPPGSYVVSFAVISNTLNGTRVAEDNPGKELVDSDLPEDPINQLPDSESNYETLSKADYARIGGSDNPLAIGRDWYQILKPHSDGIYKVYNWRTYLIKTQHDQYFKLKFTAYKSVETGEKGYPSFEYQELP
ncbi:HmuY family protein [Olivibacter sp. XZL3]|uniref:HmuY family protein n=1 Tax=Olivibacter sp. XZL3 TaxID=1735116 RepID=UPI001066F74D|nr:HmuY family protein [Olivibacter sp. XZL3]